LSENRKELNTKISLIGAPKFETISGNNIGSIIVNVSYSRRKTLEDKSRDQVEKKFENLFLY